MDKVPNEREKLKLSYKEFSNIKNFISYWEKQKEYELLKKCSNFELTRKFFIEWTLNFLRQFYPNTKYAILDYKQDIKDTAASEKGTPIIEEDYDTIAFKFEPNRPELYLIIQSGPYILDEYRFDAYEDGPFVRPDWGKL